MIGNRREVAVPGQTVMSDKYIYDSAFQNMAATGSAYAARRIISAVRTTLPVRSVVDIGCARGTWLREWQAQAVDDVVGVDGDYVDRSKVQIDLLRFVIHDLAKPFDLGRQFDLAQSLEVAEHLPPTRAASFIADLVALAPIVLFSAADPSEPYWGVGPDGRGLNWAARVLVEVREKLRGARTWGAALA